MFPIIPVYSIGGSNLCRKSVQSVPHCRPQITANPKRHKDLCPISQHGTICTGNRYNLYPLTMGEECAQGTICTTKRNKPHPYCRPSLPRDTNVSINSLSFSFL